MTATAEARQTEVSLSREAFARLTSALGKELGASKATRLLRKLGFEAGMEYAAEMTASFGDLQALSVDRFWAALSDFLSVKGWGTLVHESVHGGLGLLSCDDGTSDRMSCSFRSGLVSGVLSGASGAAVAVLEIGCSRDPNHDRCVFAFGSEQTIEAVFEAMRSGSSFEQAALRMGGGS